MDIYNFGQHRHNYAVWTAARAVQRKFTTTANIKWAIERSALRQFSEETGECTEENFEIFHQSCAKEIIDSLEEKGIKTSYGRAAKIIAIYLKTAVILCNKGECAKSRIIHPPIDSILLKSIAKDFIHLRRIGNIRWTGLDSEQYWRLINELKKYFQPLNWGVEKYWIPTNE